jgi:Tfp pilus assembly protein PilX
MTALRRRSTDEDGFVMVITMIVLMIALIVAGVAISQTVTARQFTDDTRRIDSAQQAADAGLQVALYRANQMDLGKTDFNSGLTGLANSLSCLVPVSVSGYVTGLTPVTLGANTACPSTTTPSTANSWQYESLGNHMSYAYRFIDGRTSNATSSTGHATLNPVIVSIGRDDRGTPSDTSDDMVRRVEAILKPVDPFNMIESTGNLRFNGLLLTTINGDVRTNGNLSVAGLGLVSANVLGSTGVPLRLGNAQYGGTYSGLVSLANLVHTTSTFTRTPVSISASKSDCWNGTGTQGAAGPCPSSTYYDSTAHTLTLGSNQSVTLASGDYVFCKVSVVAASGFLGSTPGGTLNTSATAAAPTRIFIDSPSSTRCNGVSGTSNPLSLQGKLNTVTTTPSALQIYIAGNGTPGGTTATVDATLTTTVTPAFFLYAPDTDVTMKVTIFEGNVIGHDVTFTGTAATVLTQDLGLSNLPLSSSVGLFTRQQYVQCTGVVPPILTPTANC